MLASTPKWHTIPLMGINPIPVLIPNMILCCHGGHSLTHLTFFLGEVIQNAPRWWHGRGGAFNALRTIALGCHAGLPCVYNGVPSVGHNHGSERCTFVEL